MINRLLHASNKTYGILVAFAVIVVFGLSFLVRSLQNNSTPLPSISTTTRQSTVNVLDYVKNKSKLTDQQFTSMSTLANRLKIAPYINEDFEIMYSEQFNKFFIWKKTGNADARIREYLKDPTFVLLYNLHQRDYFVLTNRPVQEALNDEEEILRNALKEPQNANQTIEEDRVKGIFSNVSAAEPEQTDLETINNLQQLDSMMGFIKEFSTLGTSGPELQVAPRSATPSAGTSNEGGIGLVGAEFQYDFSGDTTLEGNAALHTLLNEAADEIGVSAKLLKGIIYAECSTALNATEDQITDSYNSSSVTPLCHNRCSAVGPMQVTSGIDNQNSTSCSRCCSGSKCLSSCPNAATSLAQKLKNNYEWAHEPNVFNFRDNLYMGAIYYKAYFGDKTPSQYTEGDIKHAITCYHNGPNSSDCKNNTDDPDLENTYYKKVINYFFDN